MSIPAAFTNEYLDIDGFVLATHAYWIDSLAPLFNLERRGSVELMPYVAGGVSYRHRRNFTSVSLTLNVFGDVDVDGVAIADPRAGLYTHLASIESSLLADVTGTRTATWHRPGTDRTAQVNVVAFTVEPGGSRVEATCSLELSIPDGRFT